MTDENITEEQAEALVRAMSEGKQSVHSFFTNVIKAEDTTKIGFLTEEELGFPTITVRAYKELALFSDRIAGDNAWKEYFSALSEINTSTSLSKDGFLLKLPVTQTKQLADITPRDKSKKKGGWFKKKDDPQQPTQ